MAVLKSFRRAVHWIGLVVHERWDGLSPRFTRSASCRDGARPARGTRCCAAWATGRRAGRQGHPGPQPGSGRERDTGHGLSPAGGLAGRFNEATRGPTMANRTESEHLLDLITGYWVAQAIH